MFIGEHVEIKGQDLAKEAKDIQAAATASKKPKEQ